jgi:hydrogenase maturation factor
VVRDPRGTTTVDTLLVGAVVPGDLVLLHAGTAIARVDAVDAGRP